MCREKKVFGWDLVLGAAVSHQAALWQKFEDRRKVGARTACPSEAAAR